MIHETTRDRIMNTALMLFSQKGYHAVSVRMLAKAVGFSEAALYKHFESKRALFDALVARQKMWTEQAMDAAESKPYEELSAMGFCQVGKRFFTDFLMRDEVMCFWKMVILEQYDDAEMAAIYQKELVTQPKVYQAAIFEHLMAMGALAKHDPKQLARQFFSPALMIYFEHLGQYLTKDEALIELEAHFLHFRGVYGR